MTRTITDIRPVGIAPNLTLIADVKEDSCLLGYSVTIDQLTSDELTVYAVTEAAELEQEQHKALKIVLDVTAPKDEVKFGNVIFDIPAIAENIRTRSAELKSRIDDRMIAARERMGQRH